MGQKIDTPHYSYYYEYLWLNQSDSCQIGARNCLSSYETSWWCRSGRLLVRFQLPVLGDNGFIKHRSLSHSTVSKFSVNYNADPRLDLNHIENIIIIIIITLAIHTRAELLLILQNFYSHFAHCCCRWRADVCNIHISHIFCSKRKSLFGILDTFFDHSYYY